MSLEDQTFEAEPHCYPGGEGLTRVMAILVTVGLGTTADTSNGSDADGIYMVSIQDGGYNIGGAMLSPGGSEAILITKDGVPGSSTFTLTARATRLDAPDITASADISMAPWCDDSSGEPVGGP